MGFLSPLNLLWLAGSIGLLVLIYLRERARNTIEVSSFILFEALSAPIIKRRMLRFDLTFWLEAAALGALSLALAGLFIDRPAPPPPRLVRAIVFDLGAAMGARDGHRTRLDEARSAARSIISRAPAGERFSIIGYALKPVFYQAETADRAALESALQRLAPMAVPARQAALRAAVIRLRDTGGVDLFTDRPPAAGALADLVDPARLSVHRVGTPGANLAIVALDPGVPGVSQGHCTIRSFADKPLAGTLTVETDRGETLHMALIAEPDSEAVIAFGPLRRGGLVHARINASDDALAADNDHWAYVAPGDVRGRALVLSSDSAVRDDLSRVLVGVDPELNVTAMAPAAYSAPHPGDSPYDVAIIHDSNIPSVHAEARLLVFPPPPGEDGLTVGATVPLAEIQYPGAGSTGETITVANVRQVTLPPSLHATIRSAGDSPAIPMAMAAYGRDSQGRLGVVAFDVRNHLLMQPDEMPALLVVIDLLNRLTESAALKIVPTGEWVTVADNTGGAIVEAPDGTQSKLKAGPAGVIGFQPLQAGRYSIHVSGATTAVYANYFNEDESNLGGLPAASSVGTHPPAGGVAAYGTALPASAVSPLGGWLVALAFAALVAETIVLTRDTVLRRRSGHV
jgi:hypothetical protein